MTRKTAARPFHRKAAGRPAWPLVCAVAFLAASLHDSVRAGGHPNILLVMADDMGFSDLGCYGGEIITGSLDRLAADGLRFTQFYNAARCCPTRASLLTGLYPHQAGMGGMVDRGAGGRDSRSPYQGYLNDSCVTIAEVLRAAGYRTIFSGKWHVGENRPNWPVDRGFDRSFGLISGASSYWELDEGRRMTRDGEPYVPPSDIPFYMTDAITEHALAMISRYAGTGRPFFHYVAYTAPHWPLHAWPDDIGLYKGEYLDGWEELREQRYRRMVAMGLIEDRWPLSPLAALPWKNLDAEERREADARMAVYAAQIDRMDQGIGRIMAKLNETGVDNDTCVIFLSDNGGCAEVIDRSRTPGAPPGPVEGYVSYGRHWANASNTPFRKFKKWIHEGGIATPLIVHWPGKVPGGRITHDVGHVMDLMATVLDITGAAYPDAVDGRPVTPLEGRSLLPVLTGGSRPGHPALFWEHMGNAGVRRGDWKLVAERGRRWELYNLRVDRTELTDLAGRHPEMVAELGGLYAEWAERTGARLPAAASGG